MPALRPSGDARARDRLQRRHAEALGRPLQGPCERLRVRVLEPAARLEVRVVDDDVGVRDTSCVVVVVDDGDLVVRRSTLSPIRSRGRAARRARRGPWDPGRRRSACRCGRAGLAKQSRCRTGAGSRPSPQPSPERRPRRRRFEVDVVLGERAALLRQVPLIPLVEVCPDIVLSMGTPLTSPAR